MKKIKSGVIGLNYLLDGGINKKSITLVVGAAGTGKTTFATQFLRRGLETGHDGLFISLDEHKEQIITEAKEMGWSNITDFIDDESLVFVDANGQRFSEFVREELPAFVDDWKGSDTRIVIDPLTPVIWANDDKYTQRELLMLLFKEIKKVGTSVCTLEEHGIKGDLSGPETIIPMYLADSVVHLRFVRNPHTYTNMRKLEVFKCRNSRHSFRPHPCRIVKGFGMIIEDKDGHRIESKNTVENIPKLLEGHLNDRLAGLPDIVKDRIQSSLVFLKDEDFRNLDMDYFIGGILDDYCDGMAVR